jgi:L-lactate utilization protein LutC
MLESISERLTALDYRVVKPIAAPEGFTWDRDLVATATFGITFCETFLADTGSLILPAGQGMGTLAALLPEIHIALSFADGCTENLSEYLRKTGRSLPSRLTLISGPSRTGDIEATMTTGVHGPRRVVHLIVDDFHRS